MIIDIFTRREIDGAVEPPTGKPPGDEAKDARHVSIVPAGFERCYHKKMAIDDTQRTVKCSDCGIWLDPVWCLRELFHYYETRIDWRIQAIKEAEAKQEAAKKRRAVSGPKRRVQRMEARDQEMERAIYNEYQSKKLAMLAQRQRTRAAKIADP